MHSKLLKYLESKDYVSFYTNDDTSKFIFGKVVCMDDKSIVLCLISPDGEFDGYVLKNIDDIVRLEAKSQYNDKMMKLMLNKNIMQTNIELNESDIVSALLLFAKKERKIVSIEINYSGINDVIGFVNDVSENLCDIYQVDEYGYADGISTICLERITQISCASKENERILKLWKIQSGGRNTGDGSVCSSEN